MVVAIIHSLKQRWGGGKSIDGRGVAGGGRTETNSASENYRFHMCFGEKVGEEEWQFRKYRLIQH